MSEQNNLLSWTAPEFTRYEKRGWWFFWFILISALLILTALIMQNYLFILIIFLASFLIYIQALKHPRKINFAISKEGVTIDEKNHAFNEIKSFWIFEENEPPTLSLITKKIIQPRLNLPLADLPIQEIKNFLIKFIPEIKQEELISDVIARRIKF